MYRTFEKKKNYLDETRVIFDILRGISERIAARNYVNQEISEYIFSRFSDEFPA